MFEDLPDNSIYEEELPEEEEDDFDFKDEPEEEDLEEIEEEIALPDNRNVNPGIPAEDVPATEEAKIIDKAKRSYESERASEAYRSPQQGPYIP